jgi:hypothetical protein
LLPKIKFVKEWIPPDTCGNEEWINDMKYDYGSIALMIKNPSNGKYRMELKSSKTFHRLWVCELFIEKVGRNALACCSLVGDGWLVTDSDNYCLLYITNTGKMGTKQRYNEQPWRVNMFGHDMLAITTTKGVNFHKIQ